MSPKTQLIIIYSILFMLMTIGLIASYDNYKQREHEILLKKIELECG